MFLCIEHTMSSSEDEAEVQSDEKPFNTQEKSDATIEAWDYLLDDPYCEYHGLDKVSAIDILVEYDKQTVPKGYYTIDEYDAFYNIACRLYEYSKLKLHFKTLLNTIVSLHEYYYPVYPYLHERRFHFFDDKFIERHFQT